jgi:predicted nuclease of predicted toxin-antitoxin system
LNNFPLIIIDESTDARLTQALKETGYKTFSIQEMMPGIDDIDIIQLASEKDAYILTEDKDFGDVLVYRKFSHSGAMLLRLPGIPIEEKKRLLLTALNNHSKELLHAFSVLNKKKLRIRKESL